MENPKPCSPSLFATLAQGFLCGLLAGVAMLLMMMVLRLVFGLPTPTEMIFDRLFPLITIQFFLESLGRFGGYTPLKLAGVEGAFAGQLLVAGLGGVVYALVVRARRRAGKDDSAIGLVVGGVLAVWALTGALLWPNLLTNYRGFPPAMATLLALLATLISYSVAGLGVYLFFHLISRLSSPATRLSRPASSKMQSREENGVNFTRRRFAAAGLGAVLAVSLGGVLRRLYEIGTFAYDGTEYNGPQVQKITPNDKFYSVSKNLVDPAIAAEVWRVEIGGLVEQPRHYSLAELRAMPSVTQETTLLCISYRVGGGLASNAVWQGVPLRRLIDASRPKAEKIAAILFHAADGYYETFPYSKALEETTLVAYSMNGSDIPPKHGFPVRLVVPGLYGEKNCKWLTRLELVGENDPRLLKSHGCGFYKEQGWGPNFTVPTHSFISTPESRQGLFVLTGQPGEPFHLRGAAVGGDRGIAKVEVSTDNGENWAPAAITEPGTKIAWSIWEHTWTPPLAGEYIVVVRATDGNGDVQISEDRATVPQGSTGLHRIKAQIMAGAPAPAVA